MPHPNPSRPPSAARAARARRARTREELAREGQARDRLHAALDALGGRSPSDADVYEMLTLSRVAFSERSCAGRFLAALARLPLVAAIFAREEAEFK